MGLNNLIASWSGKSLKQLEQECQKKRFMLNVIRPHCVRNTEKWAKQNPWCQFHHAIHEFGIDRPWWEIHLTFTPNGVMHFTEGQVIRICEEVPARIRDMRSDILVKRLGWGTKNDKYPASNVVWMVKLK